MPGKPKNVGKNILNNFKNRYFRRRFVLLLFCIIILIAIIYGAFKITSKLKINAQRREYETKIFGEIQEKAAEITEFYTYGTHFQISGVLDSISEDNFENAKLVMVSGNSEQEYSIEGSIQDNKLVFSSAGLINSGINLDELAQDTYYLKLRVKLNNSTTAKYYTLVNTSSYPDIDYYTVTKNGKNNKVRIEFSKYQTIDEKELSCLKINVEEATLPDDVYDIVDGQQRLISLVLLKIYLDDAFSCSILDTEFTNKTTQDNIYTNYRFICEWFSLKENQVPWLRRRSGDDVAHAHQPVCRQAAHTPAVAAVVDDP